MPAFDPSHGRQIDPLARPASAIPAADCRPAKLHQQRLTKPLKKPGKGALRALWRNRIDPQFLSDMGEFGRVRETAIHYHCLQLDHS